MIVWTPSTPCSPSLQRDWEICRGCSCSPEVFSNTVQTCNNAARGRCRQEECSLRFVLFVFKQVWSMSKASNTQADWEGKLTHADHAITTLSMDRNHVWQDAGSAGGWVTAALQSISNHVCSHQKPGPTETTDRCTVWISFCWETNALIPLSRKDSCYRRRFNITAGLIIKKNSYIEYISTLQSKALWVLCCYHNH